MTADTVPERVVFDAEPLIAYFCDEPGSDVVEAFIDAVTGSSNGYMSMVNLAEVHYIVRDIDGEERADAVVDIIDETGIETVDVADTWRIAAGFKYRHAPALGDAFALATAVHVEGTLLAGVDDDFDGISDVSVARFRTDPG